MLTQQPRLLARTYIPIKLVAVMPREVKRQQRIATRQLNKDKRLREEAFKALQIPLSVEGLWNWYAENRECVEAIMVQGGLDAVGVGPEIDEPVVWTSDGILELHSVLLEESLKALAAKGNPTEKMDILEWMFEPDFVAEVVMQTPNGPRKTIIYNDQVAFSFAFCCKLQGHDPAQYRAFVRRAIPDVAKRFLYLDGEDTPCLQQALSKFHTPY